MKTIVENVILSGRYVLNDMLNKIDTLWVQGTISSEEREELVILAQKNANPENGYAPMQEQINQLFAMCEELQQAMEANALGVSTLKTSLEEHLKTAVEIPEPEPAEEYPQWYLWNGVGAIPWQNGSTCTHNGSKWISHVDNNIWEPGATGVYETIWEMVK